MLYDLLLVDGTVYDGYTQEICDIGITDGKIAEIGTLDRARAAEVVSLKNLSVLPGVIDTQVHFREPGLEQKEDIQTGTQSAAAGGVTTVFEMPNTNPPTISFEALQDKLRRAKDRSWCNIAFFCGASPENISQLGALENARGAPGIKIFMGSSTGSLLVPDDETLRKVLLACRNRSPVHAEDNRRLEERKALISANPSPLEHPFLRDAETARLATERLIRLAEESNHPVHILHVSTADELPLIAAAKQRTGLVTAEVTPQHLYFQAPDCYEKLGTLAQMNPPIRDAGHRAALRHALKNGLFDVIGSDHAPHTLEEKSRPYPQSPSGMPGVQTLLPVMLTLSLREGLLSMNDLVRMTSARPASLYNIRGKGFIKPGYDADLAIVDLDKNWVVGRNWIKSKCGWSPYEGEQLQGFPIHTLVNGQFSLRDGLLSDKAYGKIVRFEGEQ
ncbi:MAG TPA: dihydroorotase [Fimbriimonadaceae bacterium]|jgi:dihydroorotase